MSEKLSLTDTNEIYKVFLDKMGDDWISPTNFNKFMTCGEFTISDELHQLGLVEKKIEKNVTYFRKII